MVETFTVKVLPRCGEAVVSMNPTGSGARRPRRGEGADPERARAEAIRRARGQIRRIVTEHRCTRLATFTLNSDHATHDRAQVIRYVRALQRALKARWPGLVYVIVLELHPSGHGYHLHALMSTYIPKPALASVWGRGFVDIRKVRTRGDGGGREAARRAAAYATKYVVKDAGDDQRSQGEHRYFRPNQIAMHVVEASGSWGEMVRLANLARGDEPLVWSWSSGDPQPEGQPPWCGPPVYVVRW